MRRTWTAPSAPTVIAAMAMIALVVATMVGLGRSPVAVAQDEPIQVVTTIGQIADIAQNIGGDLVAAQALMGPGIDPHLYQATEGDINTLLEADIILYNGLNLEGRMADILVQLAGDRAVVAVTDTIPEDLLLEPAEFQGQYDPHVWFDPTLWAYTVERTAAALSGLDPDNAETYAANAEAYLTELATHDEEWLAKLATIPEENRTLVTAHDAFNYFGGHFGLEVAGLQGISTESEAGVGDVQAIVDEIIEAGIPAIFVESSVSPRTIEAVQAAVRDAGMEVEIGGELFSDAMGDAGTPEGTYIGMVDHNVNTITAALGGTVD
ncbi:MAG: zinc ABC transporter substrate-binding protein [Chloroflexota bacterium]|nr:zinc ABC transporter substrate-binding protein [Chloroflexota bacterium]